MEKQGINKKVIIIAVIVLCIAALVVTLIITNTQKSQSQDSDSSKVVDTKVETNEDGGKTYTYTYADGHTQVLVVGSDDTVGAGVEEVSTSAFVENSGSLSNEKTAYADDEVPGDSDFERFLNMTSEQQYAYFLKNFSNDPEGFLTWFNEGKEQYEKDHPSIEINPGDIISIG